MLCPEYNCSHEIKTGESVEIYFEIGMERALRYNPCNRLQDLFDDPTY